MRVANCVKASSVFAIYAISFFAPERRSQTARGLREESVGARAEGGRLRRPASLYQNHRLTKGLKLEREAIFEAPVSEAAGYLLGAHHADHDCSVARQALDHDLPALRHGHLHRLLEEGMRREGTVTVLRAGVIDDGMVTLRRLVVAGGGTAGTAASPMQLCAALVPSVSFRAAW